LLLKWEGSILKELTTFELRKYKVLIPARQKVFHSFIEIRQTRTVLEYPFNDSRI
jgi:hypothetical protein